MSTRMQQPLYILTEDTQRTQGRSAQDSNIRAGKAVAHGVFDPAAVKREAVGSAAEAATMILRIDDVIAAR